MRKKNKDLVNKSLTILRKLNHDDFRSKLTTENNLESLYTELCHLEKTVNAEKKLRTKIINHLTDNMTGNIFNKFPENEFEFEFQVLTQIINTFIEELEGNTIHLNNLQQLLNDIKIKFIVISTDGFILFQSQNNLTLDFTKQKSIKIYDHINDIFDFELISNIQDFIDKNLEKKTFEFTYQNKEESTKKFYDLSIKKIYFSGNEHILFTIRNITNTKTEEIKALKERIKGQDLERKRLALDLHDSLGQELNVIKMFVQSLNNTERSTTSYKNLYQELLQTLDQTINSIREVSFNLMPFILEQNSLEDSIKQLFNKIKKQKVIDFQIEIEKSIQLDIEKHAQLFIYRIIQEFVTNTLKYSSATLIFFKVIRLNKTKIRIEIKDNGNGFDFNTVTVRNGIRNIKERLVILNAQYIFESNKNGTSLEFSLNG